MAADIFTIWKRESQIVCGSGIVGTSYDYDSLMSREPDEVIIIGLNIATLISRKDFLQTMLSSLVKNPKLHVTLILTPDNIVKELFPLAYEHLIQSVQDIGSFMKDHLTTEGLEDRFSVRFHPAAATLSAIVCDPKNKNRGIIVFTPRWGDDAVPANRVFCSIERWKNNELFNLLYGVIPRMTQCDSISFKEVYNRLVV